MPKAEALREAKAWLRGLTVDRVEASWPPFSVADVRPLAKVEDTTSPGAPASPESAAHRPYDHPYYWAAFILIGDPN